MTKGKTETHDNVEGEVCTKHLRLFKQSQEKKTYYEN